MKISYLCITIIFISNSLFGFPSKLEFESGQVGAEIDSISKVKDTLVKIIMTDSSESDSIILVGSDDAGFVSRRNLRIKIISNSIGALIGAIIGGLMAIFVFYLGKRNEKHKSEQELKLFGDELYQFIKNITANSESQIQNLNTLVESIEGNPMKIGNYKRISFALLNRAISFDSDKVFKLFTLLEFKEKEFMKFYLNIDFLEEVFRIIDKDFDTAISTVITPQTNYYIRYKKSFLDKATDYIEKKRIENDSKDELRVYLNGFIMNYYQSKELPKGHDLFYDYSNLSRPMLETLVKHFRDWTEAKELTNIISDAANTCFSIQEYNLGFSQAVKSQIENISNSISELQLIEKKLEFIYSE